MLTVLAVLTLLTLRKTKKNFCLSLSRGFLVLRTLGDSRNNRIKCILRQLLAGGHYALFRCMKYY